MAKRKRDKDEPPLEYRLVHVNYLKRQKCRYNPSLSGFIELPRWVQTGLQKKWVENHPRMTLPDADLSMPKPKRVRR